MTSLQETRPADPARSTVRHMLRTATADLHQLVDARFSGDFDNDRNVYGRFLTTLARIVPPVERAFEVAGVDRLLPDWPHRRRADALRHDLEELALPLPDPIAVAPPDGEARLFGMLYVLEGSRLGGKLLLRRTLANPDPQVRSATRYLSHGSGDDLWRSFLARIEASAAVAAGPDEAVAGARAAFALFASGTRNG